MASELLFSTSIKIRETTYFSNFSVTNMRYDILLSMPCHEETNPNIKYRKKRSKIRRKIHPNVTSKIEDMVKFKTCQFKCHKISIVAMKRKY